MREKRAWSDGFSNVSKETFGVYPDVTVPAPAPAVDEEVPVIVGEIRPDERGDGLRFEGEGEGERRGREALFGVGDVADGFGVVGLEGCLSAERNVPFALCEWK